MPTQDAMQIKEKILSTLKTRGPSLPVHIANATEQSMLFSGAFLSELVSENKIKISNMRVGNSPLYFIEGQQPQLERFGDEFLKSKEKEAFLLLKNKKTLADDLQEPATRVALRSIKDFAIPFQKEGKIYWRYLTEEEPIVTPSEINKENPTIPKEKTEKEIPNENTKSIETKEQPKENTLEIFDKKELPPPKPKTKTTKRKITNSKTNDKLFNKVKEFLEKENYEITGLEGFSKSNLIIKAKKDNKEYLVIAYDKKRIVDADIVKAYKKSQELHLPFIILSKGEPAKKLSDLMEASKNLSGLEKF